jgi:hypothetical protein
MEQNQPQEEAAEPVKRVTRKKKKKKRAPKRRISKAAVAKAVEADKAKEGPEDRELARKREAVVAPSVLEVVHPHYTLHLHVAWDVGFKSVYMDDWVRERTLYHIVQQSSRFVVHRRDYKTYADRDMDQSYTICSIEFHDAAKSVPLAQLDQYGDARKLLAELARGPE